MADRKILIVGAGCIGVCTAHFLMEKGAPPESITLLDRDLPAGGTTGRGAGIVSYQLWNPTDVSLVEHSMAFFHRMAEASHGAFTPRRVGMLRLAFSENDARHFRAYVAFLATIGLPGRWLDAAGVREVAPALDLTGLVSAIHTFDDFYADPAGFTDGLFTLCRKRGMKYQVMTRVTGLSFSPPDSRVATRESRSSSRITGVLTDKGNLDADVVLFATGAWTKQLLASAGIPLPLKPYRTQACVVRVPEPPAVPIVHDVTRGIYFRPETGNNLLVGDGTELRESNPDTYKQESDFEFQRDAVEKLTAVYPAAKAGELLSGWAGVCSATPDRVPLLGEHPLAKGLFVACGMNGFGFMRSPAIGESVAGMILGELPKFDLTAYHVERFWRAGRTPPADFEIREGFTLS